MKKFLVPLSLSLVMTACTKETFDDEILYPEQVKNGSFEDVDLATNYWTAVGLGEVTLSGDDAFDGAYAMMVSPEECFEISYTDPLDVVSNATYELSFVTKITGLATGCLAEFYLTLEQDGNNILEVNIASGTALDWDQRVLYVRTDSSSPVYLKIYTGSEQVLLDNIRFKRIDSL
jgi:hypothetical protein